jgi:hypothetical protein
MLKNHAKESRAHPIGPHRSAATQCSCATPLPRVKMACTQIDKIIEA